MRDDPVSASGWYFFKGLLLFFILLAGAWSLVDVTLTVTGVESKGTVFETENVDGRGPIRARRKIVGEKNVNEQGLRREDPLFPPEPEEVRILVLGDSSAYGSGMEIRHAFPTVLETLLRDEGIPATVMNGASMGSGVNQMYFDFLWYKEELAVDLILIHGGWAHGLVQPFLTPEQFSAVASAKRLFPMWPLSLEPSKNIAVKRTDGSRLGVSYQSPRAIVSLASFSRFARYLNERTFPYLGKALTFKSESSQNRPLNLKESLQFYLGLILRDAAMSDIPVLTVRPMSALRIPRILDTGFWEAYSMSAFNLFKKDFELLKGQIDLMDSVFDLFAKENYMDIIDPQKYFIENFNLHGKNLTAIRKLFTDHQHFHVEGNRLVAKFIKEELLNRGFVKKTIEKPWVPETSFTQN